MNHPPASKVVPSPQELFGPGRFRQLPSSAVLARALAQRASGAVRPLIVLGVSIWMTWVIAGPGLVRAARSDSLLMVTYGLIGASSIVMLVLESQRRPYSLALAHWIFCFIFLFVAPLAQYANNDFSWGYIDSGDVALLVQANFYILLWILCWVVVTLPLRRPRDGDSREALRRFRLDAVPMRAGILVAASLVVLALQVSAYGFSGLFARGAAEGVASESSLTLIIDTFGRALPVALWLLALSARRLQPRFSIRSLSWLAAILLLLNDFPTMTPRYWTAALALGIAAHLGWLARRWTFPAAIFLGLVFIFPMLGASRHATTLAQAYDTAGQASGVTQAFQAGDYDAYAMIVHSIQFIHVYGVTSGRQLLTALLFFVPRSTWSSKSVGSGSLIAAKFDFPITNVSCPLPAEGLVNFGLVGLVAFALVSALLARRIDAAFWGRSYRALAFAYPFMPGLFFFMMRGDMLSSTAYAVGFVCAIVLTFSHIWRDATPLERPSGAAGFAAAPASKAVARHWPSEPTAQ